MYLLKLHQADKIYDIGLFASLEDGKKFLEKIPGYTSENVEGFADEYIDISKVPLYFELEYNNHKIPFTKFMFKEDSKVYVYFHQVPFLSEEGFGITDSFTLVDAYIIENKNLKDYIEKREQNYNSVRNILEENNFEVERNFFGSEDGEAIVYRKKGTDDWHFLMHMDPEFVSYNFTEEEILDMIEDK